MGPRRSFLFSERQRSLLFPSRSKEAFRLRLRVLSFLEGQEKLTFPPLGGDEEGEFPPLSLLGEGRRDARLPSEDGVKKSFFYEGV